MTAAGGDPTTTTTSGQSGVHCGFMVASGSSAVNLSVGRIFLPGDESPMPDAERPSGGKNVTPVTGSATAGPDPRGASKGREDAASTSEAASARRDRAEAGAPETPAPECAGRGAGRRGGGPWRCEGCRPRAKARPRPRPDRARRLALPLRAGIAAAHHDDGPPREDDEEVARVRLVLLRRAVAPEATPPRGRAPQGREDRPARAPRRAAHRAGTASGRCVSGRQSDPGRARRPGSPERAPRRRTR